MSVRAFKSIVTFLRTEILKHNEMAEEIEKRRGWTTGCARAGLAPLAICGVHPQLPSPAKP
jgi:hypothetical protein